MILRPYQERAVSKTVKALETAKGVLLCAPTGAGKTIMLSALSGRLGGRQIVLQHREELVSQNVSKYLKVNPSTKVSLFTRDKKSWRGDVVFAMEPTLRREKNLASMESADHIIIDEAHHIAAAGYQSILAAARDKNPDCKFVGLTATPERGDRKSLRSAFSVLADQISIKELVDLGFLVVPKAFVIDVGIQSDLKNVRIVRNEYDMDAVERIINQANITTEIIKHWKEKAGDRRTIVFCSTVKHAADVAAAFQSEGISAAYVAGDTPAGQRRAILADLDKGRIQVVCNVAVLTEGFDSQPVSCVVLLRPCSQKPTMIQMIGRGLRVVNPVEYPGIVKRDCVVLDFGTSILTHGDLETSITLDGVSDRAEPGEAIYKPCSQCEARVPAATRTCPFCGYVFVTETEEGAADSEEARPVVLTAFNLLDKSPFAWVDLFGGGFVLQACGFEGAATVASPDGGATWYGLGKPKRGGVICLAIGDKRQAISAADDFMRNIESDSSAHKTKRWLKDPASPAQKKRLLAMGYDRNSIMFGYTKYTANAHMNFQWNRRAIEAAIGVQSYVR